jgi:phage tail sheath protein FI
MIQIETSLKDFAKQFIHETNTACTWEYIKTSIEFFLCHLWKDRLLKGRWPEEAFQVQVGLGDTMVADDIFNGFMRIKVMVAPTAPSKFLEIPITLEMGKS